MVNPRDLAGNTEEEKKFILSSEFWIADSEGGIKVLKDVWRVDEIH